MKTLAWGLVAAAALVMLPVQSGVADGRHRHYHSHFSIGFGFGDPFYYRPYRYYYPSNAYAFDIWPRYRTRVRTVSDRGEVRTQKLYVYPAAGQSAEQTAEDRYQCHVWAADATEFDPTLGAGTAAEAEAYGRAFTACMEGRDYVVK